MDLWEREKFSLGVSPLVHKTLQGMPHSQEYIDNKKWTRSIIFLKKQRKCVFKGQVVRWGGIWEGLGECKGEDDQTTSYESLRELIRFKVLLWQSSTF